MPLTRHALRAFVPSGHSPIEIRSTPPLSNLFRTNTPLVDRFNIPYPTVEHAYRAAHLDPSHPSAPLARRALLSHMGPDPKPGIVFAGSSGRNLLSQIAATHSVPVLQLSPAQRVGVMQKLLRQKFADPEFADLLTSTFPRLLYEKSHPFWGLPGSNQLGALLETIRRPPSAEVSFLKDLTPHFPLASRWQQNVGPLSDPVVSSFLSSLSSPHPVNIGRRGWGELNGWLGNYPGAVTGPSSYPQWSPPYQLQLQQQLESPHFRRALSGLKSHLASGGRLYCPGCKHQSCAPGVCHGSLLQSLISQL